MLLQTTARSGDLRQLPAAQARHVADLLHITLAALGVNDDLAKAQEVCQRKALLLGYIAGVFLAMTLSCRTSIASTMTCTGTGIGLSTASRA